MLRIAIVLVVSLFPALAAAESWPVGRAPSREPSPYVYDAAKTAKAPRKFFDDSSATSLYAGTSHLVEADGTIETITHEVTRLNGRKGVEKLGSGFRRIGRARARCPAGVEVCFVYRPLECFRPSLAVATNEAREEAENHLPRVEWISQTVSNTKLNSSNVSSGTGQ